MGRVRACCCHIEKEVWGLWLFTEPTKKQIVDTNSSRNVWNTQISTLEKDLSFPSSSLQWDVIAGVILSSPSSSYSINGSESAFQTGLQQGLSPKCKRNQKKATKKQCGQPVRSLMRLQLFSWKKFSWKIVHKQARRLTANLLCQILPLTRTLSSWVMSFRKEE